MQEHARSNLIQQVFFMRRQTWHLLKKDNSERTDEVTKEILTQCISKGQPDLTSACTIEYCGIAFNIDCSSGSRRS